MVGCSFHRDVAAEVRAGKTDFSHFGVAAGVPPAVEPGFQPGGKYRPSEPEVSKI